jgi:flagellar export protein FliJ
MTGFHFRLDKVLAWRHTELELARGGFQQQAAVLATIDRRRAELKAAATGIEHQLRAAKPIDGSDLAALAAYRRHVRQREQDLAVQRSQAGKRMEQLQGTLLEARRRCRLLERLRERQFAEWQTAADREVEQVAAESHLASLARR